VVPSGRAAPEGGSSKYFYDVGSRELDQTTIFRRLYPDGARYRILCFEPNPKFAPLYKGQPNVWLLNEAAGSEHESLTLSDRSVGSSVVRDRKPSPGGSDAAGGGTNVNGIGGVTVSVTPFIETLLGVRAGASSSQVVPYPTHPGADHVVFKLDGEKAEFGILHQLARTGALTLVSELLLECHYTTNERNRTRRAPNDIGIDDCYELVRRIEAASGGAVTAVLWNSLKTARISGAKYLATHGGFYPT
jgi:hypothetical protein